MLAAAFLTMALTTCAQKKVVTITVNFTRPYCGGARPTPEMIKAASEPRPYANKTLVWVSEKGKADSAKTNEKGILKLKAAKGTYKLYEAWRYYQKSPNNGVMTQYDTECLKVEWKKECYSIVVGNKITVNEISQIIEFCAHAQPCLKDENIIQPE